MKLYIPTPGSAPEFDRVEVALSRLTEAVPTEYTRSEPKNQDLRMIVCDSTWSPGNKGAGLYIYISAMGGWKKVTLS